MHDHWVIPQKVFRSLYLVTAVTNIGGNPLTTAARCSITACLGRSSRMFEEYISHGDEMPLRLEAVEP